jgi:hypothetical protein
VSASTDAAMNDFDMIYSIDFIFLILLLGW